MRKLTFYPLLHIYQGIDNPYLSLTKAANKIKRMSNKHETGKLRSNYELKVYMLSTK